MLIRGLERIVNIDESGSYWLWIPRRLLTNICCRILIHTGRLSWWCRMCRTPQGDAETGSG